MSNKRKWIALAICLVMLFESLTTVVDVIAAGKPDLTLSSGSVTVTGPFDKNVQLSAKKIRNPFKTDFEAVAFYDIKVRHGNRTVHPDGPVTVKVAGLNLPSGKDIQVIHVLDDKDAIRAAANAGTAVPTDAPEFVDAFPDEANAAYQALGVQNVVYVEYLTTADGSVTRESNHVISFVTSSFSVYIITAQTLETNIEASVGENCEVSANFDVRAQIPGDAALQLGEIAEGTDEYDNYVSQTASLLDCEADDLAYLRLLDISLYGSQSGKYYQPGKPITVSVRLNDLPEKIDPESFRVVHFGSKTEERPAEYKDGVLSFTADGFSIYSLSAHAYRHTYRFFVPTDAEQTTYMEYEIFTDQHGVTTFTQVIKDHSELIMPQLPSIANSQTSTFAGWYEGSAWTKTGTENTDNGPVDVGTATVGTTKFDFDHLPEINETKTIYLYARFGKFAYVIFHEQYNGSTNSWPIAATRRGEIAEGEETATVRIDDVTVAYDDSSSHQNLNPGETPPPPAMAFRGWTTHENIRPDNTIPENAPLVSSPMTVSLVEAEHVETQNHLYPVFAHINWLTTISGPTGSGATYYAPTFYYSDEGLSTLSDRVPERRGYTFAGWYTDKDADGNGTGVQITDVSGTIVATSAQLAGTGLSVESGELRLSENVTIYAKWTPGTATYTVLIWRQSVTDDKNVTDHDLKSYDFAESHVITGTTESLAAVANTYKQLGGSGDYTGFFYACCDDPKPIAGNNSTVLNVYYDRELMTILFRNHPNGTTVYYYTPTNATTGTLYGFVNGEYVPITYKSFFSADGGQTQYTGNVYYVTTGNNGTQYGYVNDAFVPLTDSSFVSFDGTTPYTGTTYYETNTTRNTTVYGIVNGRVVTLTRSGGQGNRYWTYNGQRYNGQCYVTNDNINYASSTSPYGFDTASGQMRPVQNINQWSYNGNEYTGTRYTTNANYADNTAAPYGYVSGAITPLTDYSGWYTNGNDLYTGRRYTRNTQNGAVVWTGLYNQTLSYAGYNWNDVNQYAWRVTDESGTYTQTLVDSFKFSNDSSGTVYTMVYNNNAGSSEIIHYKQELNGKYSQDASITAHGSGGNFTFQDKFFGFSVSTYNTGNNGFNENGGSRTATGTTSGYPLHIYHTRNKYTLTFLDSDDNSYAYDTEAASTKSLYYEEPLTNYYPATNPVSGREGYEFRGWFYDSSCTARVNFSKPMPGGNLVIYAGWSTEWYLIKIDPNGGEYPCASDGTSSYSNWFWKQFNTTELITEYELTKRDYVESLTGTWYYAVKDRAYYGLTDEWNDIEDDIRIRTAYYTQDISDPAIVDLGVKYKYAQDAYRYANWFEVLYDDQGNEIGEQLYNFSRRIDHNITLRLHWKHIGTYNIRYDAGAGQLDGNDSNEVTFHLLDEADYADKSDIVVTRTATPPENYNFIGWRIRGDESGTIYYPGQAMEFQSRFAFSETVNGETKEYMILDAVYTVAKTATIIYDANGGIINSDEVDYGHPYDTSPQVTTNCTETQATISHLVNNSRIVLSNGDGFSYPEANAWIVGWNTKPDGKGEHFDLNAGADALDELYVDAEEPMTLYAEWKVRVYFYKNNTEPGSDWGGTWDPSVYTFDTDYTSEERYYTDVMLGETVDLPPYTPTDPRINDSDPDNDVVFHFWTDTRYIYPAEADEAYDFSQPVNKELHLYAYWDEPIKIPIHVVDSTSGIVNVDSWRNAAGVRGLVVSNGTDTSTATAADAANYVNVPEAGPGEDDYLYAFACLSDDINHVSEDKIITSVYYDNATRSAWARYANGTTGRIPDNEQIYIVYFRYPRTVKIEYKVMNTDGTLSDPASLSNVPPRITSASIGDYFMDTDPTGVAGYTNHAISTPLSWASNADNDAYPFYSFAIGSADPETGNGTATNSGGLRYNSGASSSNSNRPRLRVQNFWNGYRYSTDGGTTWTPCGKDIALYVIYYENQSAPIIVTINEKTVGLEEDLLEEFEYTVTVTQTVTTTTRTETFTRERRVTSGWGGGETWGNYIRTSPGTPTTNT
ncbi:MAG: InlB B-repeat-containing protein, partial [Clostridia bacterium]|nr:InlB B-repeat-containing protein [Clostridia bacterium]